jgi:hypothetical protein
LTVLLFFLDECVLTAIAKCPGDVVRAYIHA